MKRGKKEKREEKREGGVLTSGWCRKVKGTIVEKREERGEKERERGVGLECYLQPGENST